MEKSYYDLYCDWTDLGHLPDCGLCYSLEPTFGRPKDELFKLMKPTKRPKGNLYWGFGDCPSDFYSIIHGFTPLRQNIVLLMAAMNGEL